MKDIAVVEIHIHHIYTMICGVVLYTWYPFDHGVVPNRQ